jgi:hypothetical protein
MVDLGLSILAIFFATSPCSSSTMNAFHGMRNGIFMASTIFENFLCVVHITSLTTSLRSMGRRLRFIFTGVLVPDIRTPDAVLQLRTFILNIHGNTIQVIINMRKHCMDWNGRRGKRGRESRRTILSFSKRKTYIQSVLANM